MTDEMRFAVAFGEDVAGALSGLRTHAATQRLAEGLERACAEHVAIALSAGTHDRAPWCALWLATSEIVALGAGGDEAAAGRLRAFLAENADLVAPRVAADRVQRFAAMTVLTYDVASALAREATVAPAGKDWATEWLLGAWSLVGVITGVAIAVRFFS